jgi:multimeric flavodoxin WrbA
MQGSTGHLLEAMLGSVRGRGAEVQVFSLADLEVGPCRGCDACHRTGTCHVKDDADTVISAMAVADGVVLASPNYIFSVSAQMKALFDRCCGPLHCQALTDKYAAAVVTSGGAGADEVLDYIQRFELAMGAWTVGGVGAEGAQLADESSREECYKAARDLGERLVDAIEANAPLPDQQPQRTAFAERMRQLVTARKDHWPYEYNYWKDRGWLGEE